MLQLFGWSRFRTQNRRTLFLEPLQSIAGRGETDLPDEEKGRRFPGAPVLEPWQDA